LSNAFKFTFEGEVEVSVRKSGAGAELAVRDTGTGIPAEDLPHLFERFYRVKNAQGRTFEGSGIGLALVQELAEQHRGAVRVESEMGRGSTFTVTIPLGKEHLPAERIGARRTPESTALGSETYVEEVFHWLPQGKNGAESGVVSPVVPAVGIEELSVEGRPRIVLADDNADMREYVRRLLASSCEVQAVGDGQAALEAIRENLPDLVLSDVMMPKLDGFGLLREVRLDEETATIPVILISARAGEESRVEGLSAGADDYLTKPFSARELLARVKSQLAMAKVRRKAAGLERELREQAEAEAEGLAKLNEWSWRLWRCRNLEEGLEAMLEAVREVLGADKASIQLLEEGRGVLRIAAQSGFKAGFIETFGEVSASDGCACGRALREKQRTIVEDVEQDEEFAEYVERMRAAGVRAVVSSPLAGADGTLLGVVSGHFGRVHRPSAQSLRRLDLYIRQAADFIRRCRTDEALRRSEEQFRKLSETLDMEVRARTRALEQQSEQVRELSWRLLRTQDEERRHIARELHDSAGQTLTVLGINLAQVAQAAAEKAPDVAAEIERIQDTVQQLHREIRTTSYLLHPPMLDESGLYSAIHWYVEGLLERSGLEIRLEIPEQFGRLPRDMELVIFRVVQECLTNIHRHAESKTAVIRMSREAKHIRIEVRDQGKGMSAERLAEIGSRRSGVGIRGMRERLRQFEGTMNVESDASGTRVVVTIPMAKTGPPENENRTEASKAVV
jgi:signal transduction histidine kinase